MNIGQLLSSWLIAVSDLVPNQRPLIYMNRLLGEKVWSKSYFAMQPTSAVSSSNAVIAASLSSGSFWFSPNMAGKNSGTILPSMRLASVIVK